MAQDTRELTPEELAEQQAADLPERQAMTLITGGTMAPAYPGLADGPATFDPTTSTGSSLDPAATGSGDPSTLTGTTTEAAGSESGESTAVSEDRSEQFVQHDSASAGLT